MLFHECCGGIGTFPRSESFLAYRISRMEEQALLTAEQDNLPHETWFRIFSLLSPSDSQRVCLTCKLWNDLWQDKALWKHFHRSLLGGRPRPPLLPNAWQKSVKETLARMKPLDPYSRFDLAVRQGNIILVSQMMAMDPSLLRTIKTERRYDYVSRQYVTRSHDVATSLQTCAAELDNLSMFKMLWDFCQSIPPQFLDPQQGKEDEPSKVDIETIRICVDRMVRMANEPMLRYLLSVSPEAQMYLSTRSYDDLHSLSFATFLAEMGADLSKEASLVKNIVNGPLALWLLDRVKWSRTAGAPPAFGRGKFNYRPPLDVLKCALFPPYFSEKSGHAPRCVVKKVLKEGASSDDWGQLLEDYAKRGVIDKKVIKWLLKKHEEDQGHKEENLAFYVAVLEKGDTEMLRYLIKIGATDVNHVHPDWGKTLLQIAVEKGNTVMVESLLACGADPKAKGKRAAAPISIASQKGLHDIQVLLAEANRKKIRTGKRKRQEEKGEKEGNKEEEKQENEKEKETENGKRRKTEKEKKVESPASKKKQETERLQEKIIELHRWLCETDQRAIRLVAPIREVKDAGFNLFELKRACKTLELRPSSQRKDDLLLALLHFLEEQQALASHEL